MDTLQSQLFSPARGGGRNVLVVERDGAVVGAAGWVDAGREFFGSPMIAPDADVAGVLIDALAARARAGGTAWLRIGCGDGEPGLHSALVTMDFRVINSFLTLVRKPETKTSQIPGGLVRVPLSELAIGRLRDLHNDTFAGLSNAVAMDVEQTRHTREHAWSDGSGVWLDAGGHDRAFVWALLDRDQRGKHVLVDAIGVRAESRRLGVAGAIVDWVMDASFRAGAAEVRALVAADNAPSLALHARAGFRERSRREMFQLDLTTVIPIRS